MTSGIWTFSVGDNRGQFNRAQAFMAMQYPNEVHGLGGHCINPKCDHVWDANDEKEISQNDGYIECPNCGWSQNVYAEGVNRVGLTNDQMGQIGEDIVSGMKNIPYLGEITWVSGYKNFPIDLIAGPFGVEVKTNHSESQPRFKLGGGNNPQGGAYTLKSKLQYVQSENLRPALVGVRLNFYTDKADVFVRPDSFSDTWIGAPSLNHIATIDFSNLNPFKDPSQVPPPSQLPDDDDSDIPF